MKKYYPKTLFTKTCALLITVSVLFIIHSCRKDIGGELPITDPAIIEAKAWYEKMYPISVTKDNPGGLTTMASTTSPNDLDLSQYLKPDWRRNHNYTRFDHDVIEMPVDPTSKKLNNLFRNGTTNAAYSKKEYSRSSFLILKDTAGYKAYVMTIIADPDYMNGDTTKLARNTYSKHDTDFSGVVLYFTPKGAFVSSYAYKNGKLLKAGASTAPATGASRIQSVATNQESTYYTCIFWFNEVSDNYGNIVFRTFLYKECFPRKCYRRESR